MFAASKTDGSGVTPDLQFNYVAMLLHGDGTNGAQNNTFLDSSTNNFTITRNGDIQQGSFSPYGSNWSNLFPTSNTGSDNLTIASNSALSFTAADDFTVEAWINLTVHNTYSFICSKGNGTNTREWAFDVNSTAIRLYWSTNGSGGGGDQIVSVPFSFQLNTWYYVAMSKSGLSIRLFVNGTQQGATGTFTTIFNGSSPFRVGTFMDFTGISHCFAGNISNLRIVKGTALYTSNFTPSTTPLTAISGTSLLTCQSNYFKDNSANNFAITVNGTLSVQRFNPFGTSSAYSTSVIGGSMYSPTNSGNYLSIPNNAAFTLGSIFTVECWVYRTGSNDGTIVGRWYAGNSASWLMHIAGGYLAFGIGTGSYSNNSSIPIPINAWSHLAVSNDATSKRLYINGVLVGTYTSDNIDSLGSLNLLINQNSAGGNGMPIYISNLRIVKGTAVYTSAFTPPTAPVTAITNTVLLTDMTNGAIFDNAMMNNFNTVGNAQISTSVVKYGTGSLAFDGTGDYLTTPATTNNRINTTGNFTIELWAYFNSVALGQRLIAWDNDSNNFVIAIYTNSNGNLAYYVSASGTSWNIAQAKTMGSIAINTWYHIALVRNGSTFTPYINGVAGTETISSDTIYSSTLPFFIAATGNGTSNFNGYIDDFRITKGYARYTANFTPPSAAFPDTGPY